MSVFISRYTYFCSACTQFHRVITYAQPTLSSCLLFAKVKLQPTHYLFSLSRLLSRVVPLCFTKHNVICTESWQTPMLQTHKPLNLDLSVHTNLKSSFNKYLYTYCVCINIYREQTQAFRSSKILKYNRYGLIL